MSGYHDRLQGTDRLLRIRRIRKAVFAGLFALGILLIFVRLEGEGASLKPFFLPVNGILEVALIMGLTASIIGLFLRNLEIRHALRDNQRFLMAKSSMTRALRTAAFAIGLAIALLLAITPSLATTLFSDPLQIVSLQPNGREVVTFTSPDALGLTFVTHATVGVTNGSASVTVRRDNVNVSASWSLTTGEGVVLNIEPSMWAEYANWSLVFLNLQNAPTLLRNTRDQFAYSAHIDGSMFRTTPSPVVSDQDALTFTLSRLTVTDAEPLVTPTVAWVTKVKPRASGLVNVTTSRPLGCSETICSGSENKVVAKEAGMAKSNAIASPIANAAVRRARVIEDFAIRNRWLSRNAWRISRFRRNKPMIDAVKPMISATSRIPLTGRKNGFRLAPSPSKRTKIRRIPSANRPAKMALRMRRIRRRRSVAWSRSWYPDMGD